MSDRERFAGSASLTQQRSSLATSLSCVVRGCVSRIAAHTYVAECRWRRTRLATRMHMLLCMHILLCVMHPTSENTLALPLCANLTSFNLIHPKHIKCMRFVTESRCMRVARCMRRHVEPHAPRLGCTSYWASSAKHCYDYIED